MVKIRNKLSVIFGILLMIILVLSRDISLITFSMFLISIYVILNGIFYHKARILSILLSFAILFSVFIWLITQNAYLYSLEVVCCIATGIINLVLGIMVYSGRISEKWIRGALE